MFLGKQKQNPTKTRNKQTKIHHTHTPPTTPSPQNPQTNKPKKHHHHHFLQGAKHTAQHPSQTGTLLRSRREKPTVPGAVDLVFLWTLSLTLVASWGWGHLHQGWPRLEGHRGSNVGAVPCSPWQAISSPSVSGAIGFVAPWRVYQKYPFLPMLVAGKYTVHTKVYLR